MKIMLLRQDLLDYLSEHKLGTKWIKIVKLFESNIQHPSLSVELLEPEWHGIYSFRIDRRYRALFFFIRENAVEVFQITNHYK